MTATVPESRVILTGDEVRVSRSVRAGEWVHAVRLHNWNAGRPVMQVPANSPKVTIAGSGNSTFPYRYAPRHQDTRYRYTILMSAETTTTATVNIESNDVGTVDVFSRKNMVPQIFDVERSAQDTTEAETLVNITAGASSVDVESIMVEALPRFLLAEDANDLGADRMKFWIRQAISERNFANALLDLQNNLRTSARRCGCFAHSWGTGAPSTTTNASYENKFLDDVSIMGRHLFTGDTTRTLSWKVKAYNSDGTTAGNVRVTNDAGNTVIAVPAGTTTATWLPATADTFETDTEDPTQSDGLRGGTTDDHTFEAQRTAGSGTVNIESLSVWEAP